MRLKGLILENLLDSDENFVIYQDRIHLVCPYVPRNKLHLRVGDKQLGLEQCLSVAESENKVHVDLEGADRGTNLDLAASSYKNQGIAYLLRHFGNGNSDEIESELQSDGSEQPIAFSDPYTSLGLLAFGTYVYKLIRPPFKAKDGIYNGIHQVTGVRKWKTRKAFAREYVEDMLHKYKALYAKSALTTTRNCAFDLPLPCASYVIDHVDDNDNLVAFGKCLPSYIMKVIVKGQGNLYCMIPPSSYALALRFDEERMFLETPLLAIGEQKVNPFIKEKSFEVCDFSKTRMQIDDAGYLYGSDESLAANFLRAYLSQQFTVLTQGGRFSTVIPDQNPKRNGLVISPNTPQRAQELFDTGQVSALYL